MLKVLSYILCDLDPKVKVIGQKAGICDGVPSTSALVIIIIIIIVLNLSMSVTNQRCPCSSPDLLRITFFVSFT